MPKPPILEVVAETGQAVEPPPPEILEPNADLSPEEIEQARRDYLLTRFWISAKGFWGTNGGKLVWVFSLGLIALIITNVAFQYAKNQRSFA